MMRRTPSSTLFPYTTLFRSHGGHPRQRSAGALPEHGHPAGLRRAAPGAGARRGRPQPAGGDRAAAAGRPAGPGEPVLRRPGDPAEPGRRADGRHRHPGDDPGDVRTGLRTLRTAAGVPPIGAHVQIKGGLAKGGLAYTDAVGARAVQVFVGNPRGWRLTAGDTRQDALFPAGCAERGVPSFIHTPFLVNVGSPTEATVDQSIATIVHNRARGAQLGCQGVVVHAGSAVGEDRYADALRQLHERLLPVLEAAPDDGPRLLVEPTAGGGRSLAATVERSEERRVGKERRSRWAPYH